MTNTTSSPAVTPPAIPQNLLDFFPLDSAVRDKQAKAFDFIQRKVSQGIRDIIVAAPTGAGKTAIAAACAYWAAQPNFPLAGAPGGYYLCTQKLLQDQLEADIPNFIPSCRQGISLKTSSEYPCPYQGDCSAGMMAKPPCTNLRARACTYQMQKAAFLQSPLAVTNYAYFFTEKLFVKSMVPRRIALLDECHAIEAELLRFAELAITPETIMQVTPTLKYVPRMDFSKFRQWLSATYLPLLNNRLEALGEDKSQMTQEAIRQKAAIELQLTRTTRLLNGYEQDPDNWVYWQEEDDHQQLFTYAKPLSAGSFFNELLGDCATVRIYLSAYPGDKQVFCRNLGLDPNKTAMLSLNSSFPKDNRPIHCALVGSMGKKSQETTLPSLLRVIDKIVSTHAEEKGLIHCHSYALGQRIYDFLQRNHDARILFPRNADERANAYAEHRESPEPTFIISPSFTEGFDFVGDLARWQILAKVPYPYLGDPQTAAKKDLQDGWYAQKTVSTIIQACGRIVRNETDTGVSYLLDSDFLMLWERNKAMFPGWFQEAMIWTR